MQTQEHADTRSIFTAELDDQEHGHEGLYIESIARLDMRHFCLKPKSQISHY